MPNDPSLFTNSAGHLIGAVLESAGYVYQAHILEKLKAPLVDEIGALVYLFGIIIAITQFVVFKSSKMSPWLLIGPPIFFAVLQTDDIEFAKWSFGSNQRNQEAVKKGTNEVTGSNNTAAKVSKVFKRYVMMVSASTKAIVDTISVGQKEDDLWFLIKGELYGLMTIDSAEDPGLRHLIHYGLTGKCYQVIQAAEASFNPIKRVGTVGAADGAVEESGRYFAPLQAEAEKQYQTKLLERVHSFSNSSLIIDYIKKLDTKNKAELDKQTRDNDVVLTCEDIWRYSLQGILQRSNEHKEGILKKASELGVNRDAILDLLGQASGEQSNSPLKSDGKGSARVGVDVAKVIAKYYLRNEVRSPDRGSMLAHFASRNDIRKIRTNLSGSNSFLERSRVGVEEWSERDRLIYASLSMPYYQGLLLYFLGIVFPFFALLLIIPGKASGFLLWFLLWIWVKSWDIAMAIVMQLDTIFWSMYVLQKQKFVGPESVPNEFGAAFVALEQMDPTFQMTGYYTMLAVCVLAIPPITANFILGGMKAGASLVAQGMNKQSDFFSDAALIRTEQGVVTQLKSDAIALKELRGLAYGLGGAKRQQILGDEAYGGSVSRSPIDYSPNPANAVQYASKTPLSGGLAQQLGVASNLSRGIEAGRGFGGPSRYLASSTKGLGDLLAKAVSIQANFKGKELKQEMDRLKVDIQAQVQHAAWDADIEAKAYEIHEQMAIFRAIPVPWAEFGLEGSQKEYERHVQQFSRRVSILQAYIESIQEASEITLAPIEKGTKSAIDLSKKEPKEESKKSQNSIFLGKLKALSHSGAGKAGILGAGFAASHFSESIADGVGDLGEWLNQVDPAALPDILNLNPKPSSGFIDLSNPEPMDQLESGLVRRNLDDKIKK